VFLADPAAPTGPKVTFAAAAVVMPDPAGGKLQLHLVNGSSHEVKPDPDDYIITRFSESDVPITLAPPPETKATPFTGRYTSELLALPFGHPDRLLARIEIHRRLALPVACLVLAMVGIPLGLSSRRGGKSVGVVLTVLLVFGYYLLFFSGMRLAGQGRLRPGLAVWMADAFFFLLGLVLLRRVDRGPLVANWVQQARTWVETWARRFRAAQIPARVRLTRRWVSLNFTQILDSYLVRGFLFYFVVVLGAFVLLAEIVTVLDLLNAIYQNHAPWSLVASYTVFLAPQLIYAVAPIAVLVAVLVNFGLLTKRNEFTAIKASGISLYRASIPVFLLAALLSGGLFAFDHFTLPAANKKQEALRNQIKGRPPQTYYRPGLKWIFGQQSRIFYYNYLDPTENIMGGVTVFEFDPRSFQLRRRISAERAHWEPSLRNWVFFNGWYRDIDGINVATFEKFQAKTFAEITEPDTYFKKDVKQSIEMDFQELSRYISDLRQSGFDTVKLSVQFHKKFSFPLFALIMALIAVPFSFTVGQRGALAGVAISIAVAIVYWVVGGLFEKMGDISLLPAALAAWSPDVLFGLTGVYLLLRVRT
jgi:LPS export ABC transporter permease LptG